MTVYLVTEHFMQDAGGCTHRGVYATRALAEEAKKELGAHNLRVDIEPADIHTGDLELLLYAPVEPL